MKQQVTCRSGPAPAPLSLGCLGSSPLGGYVRVPAIAVNGENVEVGDYAAVSAKIKAASQALPS